MPIREADCTNEGQIVLGGNKVDVNRIIREKKMFVDIRGDSIEIKFYELTRSGLQIHNPAYVLKPDDQWIEGHTIEKRLNLPRPERQTIFVSDLLRFVVSSEPIFS